MKPVNLCIAVVASVCASSAMAQLRVVDLPPAMRPAPPPKLTSQARVMPSAPMTASSTLARVSPELSVSAPRRSLGAVVPDANLGAPKRATPIATTMLPAARAPDPVETRKAATILPVENQRVIQIRRLSPSAGKRVCPASSTTDKSSCK